MPSQRNETEALSRLPEELQESLDCPETNWLSTAEVYRQLGLKKAESNARPPQEMASHGGCSYFFFSSNMANRLRRRMVTAPMLEISSILICV